MAKSAAEMVVLIDEALARFAEDGFVQSVEVRGKTYTRDGIDSYRALREMYARQASAENGGAFASVPVAMRRAR